MLCLRSFVMNSVGAFRPINGTLTQVYSAFSKSPNLSLALSVPVFRSISDKTNNGGLSSTSLESDTAKSEAQISKKGSEVKLVVPGDSEYKKRFISRYMQIKLEVYGLDFLPDRNARRLIGRNEAGLLEEPRCLAQPWYWRVVLKVSKNEYNVTLKERIKTAGISTLDFSYAMAKVYGYLNVDVYFLFYKFLPFDKADIVEILEELELNDVQFESIRIMLNMEIMPEFHF